MVHLDLGALGLTPDAMFHVHDVLHGLSYDWRGAHNYVALDPKATFMHLFRIA
jgi:starch synthase (maltosyl-transferring)